MNTTTTLNTDQLSDPADHISSSINNEKHDTEAAQTNCCAEVQPFSGINYIFSYIGNIKTMMAFLFSSLFLLLSLVLVVTSVFEFMNTAFDESIDLISATIKSINILVISLAMYELGVGVGKEYINCEQGDNIFFNIRRTITRFVGTVCIAVVLEALIMIIKYSQLDMAGNLFYPVAIMVGGSVLLASLGVFLSMTRGHTE